MRASAAPLRSAAVGQFVTVLLRGAFPWARLRQAQKLLHARLSEEVRHVAWTHNDASGAWGMQAEDHS